jgi:hypothetical protein
MRDPEMAHFFGDSDALETMKAQRHAQVHLLLGDDVEFLGKRWHLYCIPKYFTEVQSR